MMFYLRYARTILRHKYYVFVAGLRTGASLWRLIKHDWTKFSPAEFGPYARNFAKGGGPTPIDQDLFAEAWAHHVRSCDHHWEWWLMPGRLDARPMSDAAIKEMLADWMGASRVYGGAWPKSQSEWDWWQKNKDRIILHPESRAKLMQLMDKVLPLGPDTAPAIPERDVWGDLLMAHPMFAWLGAFAAKR